MSRSRFEARLTPWFLEFTVLVVWVSSAAISFDQRLWGASLAIAEQSAYIVLLNREGHGRSWEAIRSN
jgi:hypothetical protein